MPAHGFAAGVSADDLSSAVVEACKRSGLALSVQIGADDSGAELRFEQVTASHLSALLLNLAAAGLVVDVVECEVASDARVVARGLRVIEESVREQDLSLRAGTILTDVSGGGPIHHPELLAGQVAARLLGRDPDAFQPVRMVTIEPKGHEI